jgi:hypothetical protein
MVTHGGDLNKAFDAWMASQEDNGRSEIRKALDSFKTGGATLGEVLSMIGAAASRPRGLVYQTAESVPSIAPVLTSGAIGTASADRSVWSVASLIGGIFPTVGSEISSELEKRGVDVTNADALGQGVQRSDADGHSARRRRERASPFRW